MGLGLQSEEIQMWPVPSSALGFGLGFSSFQGPLEGSITGLIQASPKPKTPKVG